MTWAPDLAFRPTHLVTDLPLCQVRLQDDTRWPWLILLPRIDHAVELTDLGRKDQGRLMGEIVTASMAVRRLGEALDRPVEKLNVAALGNVTPQLHIHVIGRRADDPAWPRPVWGVGQAEPYPGPDVPRLIELLRDALG